MHALGRMCLGMSEAGCGFQVSKFGFGGKWGWIGLRLGWYHTKGWVTMAVELWVWIGGGENVISPQ